MHVADIRERDVTERGGSSRLLNSDYIDCCCGQWQRQESRVDRVYVVECGTAQRVSA